MEKYQKYLSFCEHYKNSHNGTETTFSFEEWSRLYDEIQKLTSKYFNVDNIALNKEEQSSLKIKQNFIN